MTRKIIFISGFVFSVFVFSYADMEKTAEEKAEISYSAQAKSKKEKVAYYTANGDNYLMRGDFGQAIASYNEAKKIKSKNPDVYLRLGEAYRMADMKGEAVSAYNRALDYGSKDIRILLGLGSIYKSNYMYEKAEVYYKEALESEKNSTVAMKGLSDICQRTGKYYQALEMLTEIYSIEPTDEIRLKISLLYCLVGNYNEAEKYFFSSQESKLVSGYSNLEKNPEVVINASQYSNEYLLRALAYLRLNDKVNAKKALGNIIGQSENTLSKRLAVALFENMK